MAISMIRIVVMARLLTIEQFAALNLGLIISGLIAMLNAGGLFQELQRKLPVHLECKRRRAASVQIILAVIGALAVASIVVLATLGSYTVFDFAWPIAVTGTLHGFSQQLFLISATESRSSGEPMRYAMQNIIRSVLVISVTVPVAILVGTAKGILLAESAVALLASAFIFKSTIRRLSTSLGTVVFIALRSLGSLHWSSLAALVLMSATIAASVNLDRWLAARFLSPQQFAQYAFASISFTLAIALQALINASVYPSVAKRLAISGDTAAYRLTFQTSILCLGFCIVFAIPAIALSEILIERYLPQYMEATALLVPFAIAGVFRLSDFWSSFLIISGRERSVLGIQLGCLGAAFAVFYVLQQNDRIEAVALANLAAGIAASTYLLSWLRCWKASSSS